MIDIVILFFLVLGCVIGLRRGFILQSMHLFGTIMAFITARLLYLPLAEKLILIVPFPSSGSKTSEFLGMEISEKTFYNITAFIILFFVSKIILQIVATVFDYIAQLPVLKQMNKALGGLFGLIESYIVIFILLFFIAMIPLSGLESHIHNSMLANFMVNHTPLLSSLAKAWWEVIGLVQILR